MVSVLASSAVDRGFDLWSGQTDQHAELDFYSASSLTQQFADRHVAPLGYIILIPSQTVFAISPYFISQSFFMTYTTSVT
jgi:hypothetical protein